MTALGKQWRKLSPRQLNLAIQVFSLVAIFFEGYDQGVMGGVNASPDYVDTVGIGLPDGTVTSTVHQGGIVSVYYLGCIFGCAFGGFVADRLGRINGLFIAAIFSVVGGALQAATTNSDFIICARVLTGIGTGALTGITPVMVSEVSSSNHRGGFLGYIFIANYLGISVAYWMAFGLAFVDNGYSEVRWRFLLAFQCFPALLLLAGIRLLPDSPRYLATAKRFDEAKEVLYGVRGKDFPGVEREYLEICAMAEDSEPSSLVTFSKVVLGISGRPGHTTRRAWLCIWLQIMASWTGITAVTAYSPVLLSQAGYSKIKQDGLAGGLNTIGIIGTIISAHIVDKYGRRVCLMGGAAALGAVNLIAAALYEGSIAHPEKADSIAPAAVTMLFLFNLFYASTWGTVAFLLPTEIFPSEMRAQGNAYGITGWALGVGMTTLVNPIMFDTMRSRTYFLFAGLNFLWIPTVFLFYPETKDRSLESIETMFTADSPFFWNMEKAYALKKDILAERGSAAVTGEKVEPRKQSLDSSLEKTADESV